MRLLILFLMALAAYPQTVMRVQRRAATGYKIGSSARQFSGTAQYLQSASALNYASSKVLSISFYMYWDAFGADDSLMAESSENYNSNAGAFIIDPEAGAAFGVNVKTANASLQCNFDRPTAAAWHHYLIVWDLTSTTNTCTPYVDGSAANVSYFSSSGDSQVFGNFTLNVFSRNAGSLLGAGRLSELAIWKSALTSGNAGSLAKYADPGAIDGTNLLYHWHLGTGTTSEVATVGSTALNVTGATIVSGPNP